MSSHTSRVAKRWSQPIAVKEGWWPDVAKLHQLARLGARCIAQGLRVLCHCGMGHHRSALLAGLILTYLGMPGAQAVAL